MLSMWFYKRNSLSILLASSLLFPYSAISGSKVIEATQEPPASKQVPMEDIQRFSNALGQIKKYYVKPTEDKDLFDNAIRGMLNGLDPHSAYLDEEAFKELHMSTSGEFAGLGIEVTMEDGVIKVVTPLVETPAYKAGIKAGDYIIKIGNHAVQGISLRQAVELMRGKEGTSLDLTILRKGEAKPLAISVVREKIFIKSVKSKLLDGSYGYVRLTQFQALTAEDMGKAISELTQQSKGKLNGLILDLRNNPGGLLDSAIQVADAFLDAPKGSKPETIVYTQGRLAGSKFSAFANPGDLLNKAPLVVLINNGSASASEIVAGALKDNKRALILGTQSFGKGSVQTVLPLDDKRAIKLTTALYYTPSGVSIQAKGITPDILVEEVAVPKSKDKPGLTSFSEADLNGHLIGKDNKDNQGNDTNQTTQTEQNNKGQLPQVTTKDEQTLLYEDYQLYTALTVLKGLSIAIAKQ